MIDNAKIDDTLSPLVRGIRAVIQQLYQVDPNELENDLYQWAKIHHPAAARSIYSNPNDPKWKIRCLASICRKRGNDDLDWFVVAMVKTPDQLKKLAPYLGRVGGWPMEEPTVEAWKQYIDDRCFIQGIL